MRHVLGLAALSAALVAPAFAQTPAATPSAMTLAIGQGSLVRLEQPATTVFVANPDVADIQIAGPQSIFVFGQAIGRTTLFALDADGGAILQREITVEHDLSKLRQVLAQRFPDTRVTVSSGPGSVMIQGDVATAQQAEAIANTVAGVVGEGERLVNRLTVDAPSQVSLRVRVAEVSRNIDQRLGFNWRALFSFGDFAFGVFTGAGVIGATPLNTTFGAIGGSLVTGDVDINVLIDALNREGLARTLAEPNLTALSGETASFTAGGEFPIPVAQDGGVTTIEFRQFGVILDFTPTVLSPDRISLRVRPEVSDLSQNGAIQIEGGLNIPALSVRRVDTTVELASGQSLVIGGLLQQSTRDLIDKVPGLGDIPMLGTLFTSTRYQNDETELIVTVTPYVVRPTRPDALATPLGAAPPGQSLEALLRTRAAGGAAPQRLHGPVGFVF